MKDKVRGLKRLLYVPLIAIASLGLFGKKAEGQLYTVNPFVQPNDSTALSKHGGGDINGDKTLNWDDYYAMQDDSITNKEADIDGDGIPGTQNDKQILEERLNGEREYLPLELNKLETYEERKEYAQKLSEIYGVTVGDCETSSTQTRINLYGFGDLTQSETYDLTRNGWGNAPFYDVWIFKPGEDHAATCMAIKDSAENLSSWHISDPSHQNLEITQERLNDMGATEVWIQYTYVNSYDHILDGFPILKFKIENGNSNLIWENNDPNVKIIKHRDDIPTKLEKEVLNSKIKICPNPVVDYLKIEGFENGKIGIYDISGRELENRLLKGNEIDMKNYKPGIYILKAEDSNGKIYSGKVIKE